MDTTSLPPCLPPSVEEHTAAFAGCVDAEAYQSSVGAASVTSTLNLKSDRTEVIMLVSQNHLQLTYETHLMVAYALMADIFDHTSKDEWDISVLTAGSGDSNIEHMINYKEHLIRKYEGVWGSSVESRLLWAKLQYIYAVIMLRGLIQGTRDGDYDAVLTSLKELRLFLATDSGHYKKQMQLGGMLLDLENVSRWTRDIIKRSALTVPWRGGFEMGVE